MGTSLEGSVDEILGVVAQLHSAPLDLGFPRAYTVLKIDERPDHDGGLDHKVSSVQRRLDETG